nr:MAG TPA: hypothetical protein [Caudoviricetes sp.]
MVMIGELSVMSMMVLSGGILRVFQQESST